MSTYTIMRNNAGKWLVLLLGTVIASVPTRAEAERIAAGLTDRKHAERVLRSVRYNAPTNTIEDGETNA